MTDDAVSKGEPLDRDRVAVLLVDIQEGFRPVIDGFDELTSAAAILLQGALALELPVIVTEQYPRGLGSTVEELAAHLDDRSTRLEKTVFAATGADGFDLGGRDQVLICGVESHICVHQTTQQLRRDGVEVSLACDAISSRTPRNRELGIARMEAEGAMPSSVEMALFELLGEAGSPEFKAIQALVK